MTAMEVIDLTKNDAKIVYDLTGETTTVNMVDLTRETPGRTTKTQDDVLVEIDGIQLSMKEAFTDKKQI